MKRLFATMAVGCVLAIALAADGGGGAGADGVQAASSRDDIAWDCLIGPKTVARLCSALRLSAEESEQVVASHARYDEELGACVSQRLREVRTELLALEARVEPILVDDEAFESAPQAQKIKLRRWREEHAQGKLVLIGDGEVEAAVRAAADLTTKILWKREAELRLKFVAEVKDIAGSDDERLFSKIANRVLVDAVGEGSMVRNAPERRSTPSFSFAFNDVLADFMSRREELRPMVPAIWDLRAHTSPDTSPDSGDAVEGLRRLILEEAERRAGGIAEWLNAKATWESQIGISPPGSEQCKAAWSVANEKTRRVVRDRAASARAIAELLRRDVDREVADAWDAWFWKRTCPAAFLDGGSLAFLAKVKAVLKEDAERNGTFERIRAAYLDASDPLRHQMCEALVDEATVNGHVISGGRFASLDLELTRLAERMRAEVIDLLSRGK